MQLDMKNQRGDTLIEVILAVSILALVTVSSFAIMQRASASAYDAMERSSVRMTLTGQVDLLLYARDAYLASTVAGNAITPGSPAELWQIISAHPYTATTPTTETCDAPSNAFYIVTSSAATPVYTLSTSYVAASGIPEPGKGLWVAKINPTGAQAPKKKYQEFYVVACWQSTAGGEQRMSSVVRVYDPIP